MDSWEPLMPTWMVEYIPIMVGVAVAVVVSSCIDWRKR